MICHINNVLKLNYETKNGYETINNFETILDPERRIYIEYEKIKNFTSQRCLHGKLSFLNHSLITGFETYRCFS